MIKNGVYAAGLSVLNVDRTLNIDATINHASKAIQSGLHGVFFFGSTGQSQLISTNEKKELIAKIASHKLRKQFFLGTGNNSLHENIDLIVCDVSFISLTKVIEPSLKLLSKKAEIISLIKPQFETKKINLKKGIVKDPIIHGQVCNDISKWFKTKTNAEVIGLVESPITGPKGNKEFLIYCVLEKS